VHSSFHEEKIVEKRRGLGRGLAGLLAGDTDWQPPKVALGRSFKNMEEEVLNFSDVITEYLKTRFSCKVRRKIDRQRIFLEANDLDLMFRYKFTSSVSLDNNLVIARIEFPEERRGHGTNLLKKVANMASKYGIENITIESVNNKSRSFAEKLGFKQARIEDVYHIDVNTLTKNLEI
jgi:hypothetical protein